MSFAQTVLDGWSDANEPEIIATGSTVTVMVLLLSIQATVFKVLIACLLNIVVTFKVEGSYVILFAPLILLNVPDIVLLCHW